METALYAVLALMWGGAILVTVLVLVHDTLTGGDDGES